MSNILEREESVEQVFNFLEKTLEVVLHSGHTEEDILYVGSNDSNYRCSWAEFKIIADVDHHNETEFTIDVADDLLIVFKDNIVLWRDERRGDEFWNFAPAPFLEGKQKKIKNIFPKVPGLTSLSQMNEERL